MDSHLIPENLLAAFQKRYQRRPVLIARAPGRVVLLGAHVDYNEGWVLPAAIDRSVWVAAAPVDSGLVTVYSLEFGQEGQFELTDLRSGADVFDWLRYPMGVAWALQKSGYRLQGMQAVVASDVPMGAGVSSSAALEMALVLTWEAISRFEIGCLQKAQIGQHAENSYLGVGSGIMDQFASIHGAVDQMILLDCRTLAHELVPVPPGTALIVVDSGVRRALARINYNDRPEECRQATAILRQHLPKIQTLRDVNLEDFEVHAHRLPPTLRKRARHVIEECDRVITGAEALRQGDITRFGKLVRQSQVSSRDNYENSIPELDLLAATSWTVPGCYGARFAGGGFGGVMQILCVESAVQRIQRVIAEDFKLEFNRSPFMFTCKIASGAELLWL